MAGGSLPCSTNTTKTFSEETQTLFENSSDCEVPQLFIYYYFLLLFLICFVTPVLITISLNFFIWFAVQNTQHESLAYHQWLTLSACVLMWGPSLVLLLVEKASTENQSQV